MADIPRLSKETSIFKPSAIAGGIADASETATNYISADESGIRIANATPATAQTYQHQTATDTEFVVGSKSMAKINGDGARFGATSENNLNIDYHSIQLKDSEGETYFHVSDLRDHDGKAEIQQKFVVKENTYVYDNVATFWLSGWAMSTDYTVTIADTSTYTINKEVSQFHVSPAPPLGTEIHATYWTSSDVVKAYTFGKRANTTTEPVGPNSVVMGMDSAATELNSIAIGPNVHVTAESAIAIGTYDTTANGSYSVAIGQNAQTQTDYSYAIGPGTRTEYPLDFAIGMYNATPDPNDGICFVIGNGYGTDPSERSNAVEIDRTGGVYTGQDVRDWQSIEIDPDNNGFAAYSSGYAPKGRRFGHTVEINGAVKPTANKASGSNLTFARIPERLRPDRDIRQLCQGSTNSVWLLVIDTNGYMHVERYRDGATSVAIPSGAWLVFDVTYTVKEYIGGQ